MIHRVALVCVLLAACSEATDGVIDAGWTPPFDDTVADGGPAGSSTSSTTKPATDAAVITASSVLLNELSASGEWVEIVNGGAAAVDLGGWMVADLDKDTGGPKIKDGVTFAEGTTLAPGAYGMVLGGGVDAGKPCPAGGATFCVPADFGISKKNGETIFLLGKDGGVLGTMVFPPSDAGSGQSWCRQPNADPRGQFQPCDESPGAPN